MPLTTTEAESGRYFLGSKVRHERSGPIPLRFSWRPLFAQDSMLYPLLILLIAYATILRDCQQARSARPSPSSWFGEVVPDDH